MAAHATFLFPSLEGSGVGLGIFSATALILLEPEELLRGGEEIGVRTRRAGQVGERAGAGRHGLQTEASVGALQHQLIVQQLKSRIKGSGSCQLGGAEHNKFKTKGADPTGIVARCGNEWPS